MPTCAWIVSIVSSIAHPLEAVTITMYFDHMAELDAFGFSALDTLFLSKALSNNSTKLRICTSDRVDIDEFRAVLIDSLPKLHGRKQLELVLECM